MEKPFPQSYWLIPGKLLAGHYPADLDSQTHAEKLSGLIACGIRRVLNLTLATETGRGGVPFISYGPELTRVAEENGFAIECTRDGFQDGSVPDRETMSRILDILDNAVAEGTPLYFHCWGGHGRTGTVAACYLIRHGMAPEDAIERVCALRRDLPKSHFPFEGAQAEFVQTWKPGE